MKTRVCLIEGDGVGREVIPAARTVLEATGVPLEFVTAEAGWETFQRTGQALPDETLSLARTCDAVLFGAVGSPSHRVPGYASPIVALRRELDLYACLRPIVLGDDPGRVGLGIVRESTEGLYAGRERRETDPSGGHVAVAERVVTERASRRVARLAIGWTRQLGLSRITVVHKANVLRETCGLFRDVALDELTTAPDLEVREGLVDSAALALARDPGAFGVILTTNLFGDILSDLASVHAGGLGLVESMSIGDDHALFEPVHGSAPDIAGRGLANPLAAIRAGARLLEHRGHGDAGAAVLAAVQTVLDEGPRSADRGGDAGTASITAAVLDALARAQRSGGWNTAVTCEP